MVGLKRFESLNPGDNKEMDETWMHTVIYSALGLCISVLKLQALSTFIPHQKFENKYHWENGMNGNLERN